MNRHAQNRSRNILLIGMPCSGKTSFGKNYAFRTGRQFVDFDLYVERYAGKSLKEIVASEGEAGFRSRVVRCLRRLDKRRGSVIAIGGGVLFNPEQFRFARSLGLMIWLETPVEILAARIFEDRQLRPLFSPLSTVEQTTMVVADLLEKRRRYYECADVWMETTHSSVDNLALQMLAVERRAHSLIQRRETPAFLYGGKPLLASSASEDGGDAVEAPSVETSSQEAEAEAVSTASEYSTANLSGAESVSLSELQPEETWDDVIWRETINSPIEKSQRREQGGTPRSTGHQGAAGGSPAGEGGGKRRRKRRGRGSGEEGRGEGRSEQRRDPRPEPRRDNRNDGRGEQRRDQRGEGRPDQRRDSRPRRDHRPDGRPGEQRREQRSTEGQTPRSSDTAGSKN